MKTFLSLALLTMVTSSVRCGDLPQILVEPDTWCENEKCYKDVVLSEHIKKKDHSAITNHLKAKQKLSKKDIEMVAKHLQQAKWQRDLTKRLNQQLEPLPLSKATDNGENTQIKKFIENKEAGTLATYVAGLTSLSSENKNAIKEYIEEVNRNKDQLKDTRAIFAQKLKKQNSYCHGCLVKPPSCGDTCCKDPLDKYCWTACFPCMLIFWAFDACEHCCCPIYHYSIEN